MDQDQMLWGCMKDGHCSFRIMTKTQLMCKNENNVTGLCAKSSCPLANSNYATIREHKGQVYLYKKVIERAAFPHKLWEKIKLPEKYEDALAQIDVLLPYWEQKQVHRCKQRYTKIYQYLERARKQATKMRAKKLITLPRKMERREKAREKKALRAAKLENDIEIEIMNRVKQGVYGDRYQFKDKNVFEKALVEEDEILADELEASTSKGKGKKRAHEQEIEVPRKMSSKYVADIEDLADDPSMDESSDSDLDMNLYTDSDSDSDDS